MLQPLPLRAADEAVQEGLCDAVQEHRGEPCHQGHREMQVGFFFNGRCRLVFLFIFSIQYHSFQHYYLAIDAFRTY